MQTGGLRDQPALPLDIARSQDYHFDDLHYHCCHLLFLLESEVTVLGHEGGAEEDRKLMAAVTQGSHILNYE